jgi:hypothetical protein
MWISKKEYDELKAREADYITVLDANEDLERINKGLQEAIVNYGLKKSDSKLDNHNVEEIAKTLEGFASKKDLEELKGLLGTAIRLQDEEFKPKIEALETFKTDVLNTQQSVLSSLQEFNGINENQKKLLDTCVDTVNQCIESVKQLDIDTDEKVKMIIETLEALKTKEDDKS